MSDLRPVYSVLHPDDIAGWLSRHWFEGQPVHCELLSRSWSDVYRVRVAGVRHAARVWRAGFHSAQQIDFSCRCLEYFASQGIRVAAPRPMPGGGFRSTVRAPEGLRHVAVFDWFDGVPVGTTFDEPAALAVGDLLARLHVAGMRCDHAPPSLPPMPDAESTLVAELSRALQHRHVRYEEMAIGMQRVECDVVRWASSGLPRGLVHGDFHPFNVLRSKCDSLALIDFDDVCFGPLLKDIASLQWALEFLGAPPRLFDDFLRGYEIHRPLTADERAALPSFVAERDCWNIRGWAANINVLGDPQGRFDHVLAMAIERFSRMPP